VSTEIRVDIFWQKLASVRSVLCIATIVTEQLWVGPTYSKAAFIERNKVRNISMIFRNSASFVDLLISHILTTR